MITFVIIAITVLVSATAFTNSNLFYKLTFDPYQIERTKQYYRFITHALLHADWTHLLVNMLVFYSFGQVVESYYNYHFESKGDLYFVLLYVSSIAFACLPDYRKNRNNPHHISVGASGGVSAIVFSSILFSPLSKIYLFGILPMPAIVFAVLYLVYEYYAGKKNNDNINHDAHIWGAIYGAVFTIAIKPELAILFFQKLTGME